MDKVAAIVLAGGRGGDFGALSEHRTKAAFPVGGFYRVIDFVLTNLSHSGIRQVGVVIQFLPASLMEHIGSGRPWDFDMADRRLRFMTPFVGVRETRWFRGTGDAIAKNLNLINMPGIEDVLVLSGDHVYQMDYGPLLRHHRESGADVTMAAASVPYEQQHPRFGNIIVGENGRVHSFIEKPLHPVSPLVSIGIYCFKRDVLLDLVTRGAAVATREEFSLAGDILQAHVGSLNAQCWTNRDPWYYLADLREYFEFHLALASCRIDLFDESWRVITNYSDRGLGSRRPAYFAPNCHVDHALISPGCDIEGTVTHSVLSPGVRVAPGAVVDHSIIFHDVTIGEGCYVHGAVIDKDVTVEAGARIEGLPGAQNYANGGGAGPSGIIVVPKGCRVRRGETLAPGMSIDAPAFF